MKHVMSRFGLAIIFVLSLSLLTFGVALAANFTINASDGVVDSQWTGQTPIVTGDLDGGVSAGYDIDSAWIATFSNPPAEIVSFRVLMEGPIANDAVIYGEISCDNDDNFLETVDRAVIYDVEADLISIEDGMGNSILAPGNASFGEVVGSSLNAEWYNPAAPATAFDGCFGTVRVRFSVLGIDTDSTTPRSYNMPTAIEVQRISASSPLSLAVVAIGLGIVGLAAFALLRRR